MRFAAVLALAVGCARVEAEEPNAAAPEVSLPSDAAAESNPEVSVVVPVDADAAAPEPFSLEWVARANAGASSFIFERRLNRLYVDDAGDSYAYGYINDASDWSVAAARSTLVKLDSSGSLVWSQSVDGRPMALGRAGVFMSTPTVKDTLFELRDAATGTASGWKAVRATSTFNVFSMTTVGGNVYIAGTYSGALDFGDDVRAPERDQAAFLVAFDDTWRARWVRTFTSGAPTQLESDSAGHLVLAGYVGVPVDFGGGVLPADGGTAKLWSPDTFVASFDAGGNHRFSRLIDKAPHALVYELAIAPGTDDIYVATSNGVTVLTSDGTTRWSMPRASSASVLRIAPVEGDVSYMITTEPEYVLRRYDGPKERWRRSLGKLAMSNPGENLVVRGDSLFFGAALTGDATIGGSFISPSTSHGDVFVARLRLR